MLTPQMIQSIERQFYDLMEEIFGELQSEFDMKRECLDLDKFEKVKNKWLSSNE